MITEDRLKYYELGQHVSSVIETAFLMQKAGKVRSVVSNGLTTVQYKINSGTYATPTTPFTYNANDMIWFTYSYTDQTVLQGNIIINIKDN